MFDCIEFPAPLAEARPVLAPDDQSVEISMAGKPASVLGFNNGGMGKKVASAFEMTPEMTTLYAGKKITKISFYTGKNTSSGSNKIGEYHAFIAEGEALKPVVEKSQVCGSTAMQLYTVTLDEPYTIEAGKSLKIGAWCTLKSAKDYTIVVDGKKDYTSNIGGWASISANKNANFLWQNVTSSGGYVCVSATIEGENMPQNMLDVQSLTLPDKTTINTPFDAIVTMMNTGANEISSLELKYKVGSQEELTKTLDVTVDAFKTTSVRLSGLSSATACAPVVTVKVSKINGTDVSDKNLSTSGSLFVFGPEGGFAKNVVIEEFTGTWCGYCPRGYVTMEYIHEHCTDGTIIPVCVHAGDAMEAASFAPVNAMNQEGYPNAMFNRSVQNYPYPQTEVLGICEQLKQDPSAAKINLTCSFNEFNMSELLFEGTTEFAFDVAQNPYLLSFAITEDNVGPYDQNNNYGSTLPGFTSNPQSCIFNDVARQLDGFKGIEGTVPENVVAHEENPFRYIMKISDSSIKTGYVNAIAYLVNKNTGALENVVTVKAANIGISGIEDITVNNDNNAPVEYFNLQGIRVENPSNGLFIRRQGNKAEKILVK